MDVLSARLTALSPSETFAMAQKSNELKASGIDVINMSVGEPDFTTPDHIKQAAKKAIEFGVGHPEYEEATEYEAQRWCELFNTQDQKEGMMAFLEKRKPHFAGK